MVLIIYHEDSEEENSKILVWQNLCITIWWSQFHLQGYCECIYGPVRSRSCSLCHTSSRCATTLLVTISQECNGFLFQMHVSLRMSVCQPHSDGRYHSLPKQLWPLRVWTFSWWQDCLDMYFVTALLAPFCHNLMKWWNKWQTHRIWSTQNFSCFDVKYIDIWNPCQNKFKIMWKNCLNPKGCKFPALDFICLEKTWNVSNMEWLPVSLARWYLGDIFTVWEYQRSSSSHHC
jgi:hypothetical protein